MHSPFSDNIEQKSYFHYLIFFLNPSLVYWDYHCHYCKKPRRYIHQDTPQGQYWLQENPSYKCGITNEWQYVERPFRYPGEYCPSEGSKAKNPWGLRPIQFLALEIPRDTIHQDTPNFFFNPCLERGARDTLHCTAKIIISIPHNKKIILFVQKHFL